MNCFGPPAPSVSSRARCRCFKLHLTSRKLRTNGSSDFAAACVHPDNDPNLRKKTRIQGVVIQRRGEICAEKQNPSDSTLPPTRLRRRAFHCLHIPPSPHKCPRCPPGFPSPPAAQNSRARGSRRAPARESEGGSDRSWRPCARR